VVVVIWLVLALALLLFELHHLALYALFAAVGAAAAALVAVVAPDAYVAQGVVAVAVASVTTVTLRPVVSRAVHHHRTGDQVARGVHGGIVGQEALTLDAVGSAQHVGHVRLAGERWLAVSGGPDIPASTTVVVTAVRGTTLVVWPVEELGGTLPPGAEGSAT
jgi:membrane protein implicated in regulation of membrane protease activity